MSTREKQLLTILFLAGFFLLNVFLYSLYTKKINESRKKLELSKLQFQTAVITKENSEALKDQMDWLAANEPEAAFAQDVQSKLLAFAVDQATALGLTIKSRNLDLPTETDGGYYDRAQIKINLSGREQALFNWLHQVNDPALFRTTYQLLLSPNTQDDTLIDCSATIVQWFPPAPLNP